MPRHRIVTDIELIGPHFLVVCLNPVTGQFKHFWHADRDQFSKILYCRNDITFVGFNSESFDAPLIEAWQQGFTVEQLRRIADSIINDNLRQWQTVQEYNLGAVSADWIDLKEPAPGVMISLKTYEGRMHFHTMQDLPFDHTAKSLTAQQQAMLLSYCKNDVLATAALLKELEPDIELREAMGFTYGLDLRSKSGAQIAEQVLSRVCDIPRNNAPIPQNVTYSAPDFIRPSPLVQRVEQHVFTINPVTGAPEFPEFLRDPIRIGEGLYQFGIGGLHSQHDTSIHYQATPERLLTDFDVASFYPSLILKAGIVPELPNSKGEVFLKTYRNLFDERIAAKRTGEKLKADALKLILNSAFGKLGSKYCRFYAPDLLLAVTISGQLFLIQIIEQLEVLPDVAVVSANTDGLVVTYPPHMAQAVQAVFDNNEGFEFESTPYREIAFRDVNSYVAVSATGKVKCKGVFAPAGLRESTNPTFQICAQAAAKYIQDRTLPEETVNACKDVRQFISVRNVKGGGVHHPRTEVRDNWQQVEERLWVNCQGRKERRKSRPKPYEIGVDGVAFGRVARWYRGNTGTQPITYLSNGNKVPDSDSAVLCMELPKHFPSDIDLQWYVERAYNLLRSAGVEISGESD